VTVAEFVIRQSSFPDPGQVVSTSQETARANRLCGLRSTFLTCLTFLAESFPAWVSPSEMAAAETAAFLPFTKLGKLGKSGKPAKTNGNVLASAVLTSFPTEMTQECEGVTTQSGLPHPRPGAHETPTSAIRPSSARYCASYSAQFAPINIAPIAGALVSQSNDPAQWRVPGFEPRISPVNCWSTPGYASFSLNAGERPPSAPPACQDIQSAQEFADNVGASRRLDRSRTRATGGGSLIFSAGTRGRCIARGFFGQIRQGLNPTEQRNCADFSVFASRIPSHEDGPRPIRSSGPDLRPSPLPSPLRGLEPANRSNYAGRLTAGPGQETQ